MLHVKHFRESFLSAVRAWDRVHRIIGKENPAHLWDQALESLNAHLQSGEKSKTLVDIGAGSGLIGFAWLGINPSHRVVFVEPKKKAAAFLHSFIAAEQKNIGSRSFVLAAPFESVSRETVVSWGGEEFFGVARAFSGHESLESVILRSQFANDRLFVFSALVAEFKNPQYRLRQINGSSSTRG